MEIAIILLLIWNIFVFLLFGVDKMKAKKNRWRVPERTLLLCAFFLGSLGAVCGMEVFRHKTRHNAFRFGLPAMLALHLALAAYLTIRF